ncbi:MAG: MFS transporter [Betaproteobacteria bacterium]|nr:MFS transporter [Betaproteobacteria bacterium]
MLSWRNFVPRIPALLLNLGHALDHLFLLIFATAVSAIAADFGIERWEDLMPYTVGAFFMFGVGSVPAGRLGDLWGRRKMMLVFFYGIGLASIAVAFTQSPWQIAAALTVLGQRPGVTIGINGLAGNLGIAFAALSTGLLVKYFGWRMAFVVPGLLSIAAGFLFSKTAPIESAAPASRKVSHVQLPKHLAVRTFMVMVASGTTGSLLFNFTTNGNTQMLTERLEGIVSDPASIGMLMALVYAIASIAQVIVGRLIDRFPVKPLFFGIVASQIVLFALASQSAGWLWYLLAVAYMISVFGAIPFSDAMVVRYIDDSMRSRVSGIRIAISFGISSLAVYMLGPLVKASGFTQLLIAMSFIAAVSAFIVLWLPGEAQMRTARQVTG